MGILSPAENRQIAQNSTSDVVASALQWCNVKIQEAMRVNENSVQLWTGIECGDDANQRALELALTSAGYRIDSDMRFPHGLIIDIEWD